VQVEHVVDSGSTPEIHQENVSQIHTDVEPPHCSIAVDRPKRDFRPIKRLIQEVNMASYCLNVAEEIEGIVEPSSYSKAIVSSDKINGTWSLVKLPREKKPICCKWVFKRKEGVSPNDEARYKARLVAKGYNQIPGIEFNEIFSPIAKDSSIHTLLSIFAMHDYELE
jgi:hypothetical protein